MSDITKDYSFGGWLKHLRIERQITLRTMAEKIGIDAGNYSKIERSVLNPPEKRSMVIKLLKPLQLSESQVEFLCGLALESKLTRAREDFLK